MSAHGTTVSASESWLVIMVKLIGICCATLTAVYWCSFALTKLGNYLVHMDVWHTDSIAAPVHPTVGAGTPLWLVAAFWAVTVLGVAAWIVMVAKIVVRLLTMRRG